MQGICAGGNLKARITEVQDIREHEKINNSKIMILNVLEEFFDLPIKKYMFDEYSIEYEYEGKRRGEAEANSKNKIITELRGTISELKKKDEENSNMILQLKKKDEENSIQIAKRDSEISYLKDSIEKLNEKEEKNTRDINFLYQMLI